MVGMGRFRRALPVGACTLFLCLTACGSDPVTPDPTPTTSPSPTIPPPLPVDTPVPTFASGPGGPGDTVSSRHHPIFTMNIQFSGSFKGRTVYTDVLSGASFDACSDTTAANSDGTWTAPDFTGATIGMHQLSDGISLTTSGDNYTGPGTYKHPQVAPIFIDGVRYDDTAATFLTVATDGSGTLTLGKYTSGKRAITGTVSWTCVLS